MALQLHRRGIGILTRGPQRRRRAGSVLLVAMFALVVLLGCAALTIDVGMVGVRASRLQGVCDASALAGAGNLDTAAAAQNAAAAYYQVNLTGNTTQPVGSTSGATATYAVNGGYRGGDHPPTATPTRTPMSWDPNNLVKISTASPFPLMFAKALGINSTNVARSAVGPAHRRLRRGVGRRGGLPLRQGPGVRHQLQHLHRQGQCVLELQRGDVAQYRLHRQQAARQDLGESLRQPVPWRLCARVRHDLPDLGQTRSTSAASRSCPR